MPNKRLTIASLCGLAAGIICYLLGIVLIPMKHDFLVFIWVVFNRTLLGFVIGISSLKVHWSLNGLIIGSTVGLVLPLNAIMLEKELPLVISVYIMTIIYAIVIEFFTSVVFKHRVI